MNVSNSLLQLLGALQQAPASGSATVDAAGGGLATLFGELLAAAQAAAASMDGTTVTDTPESDAPPIAALIEALQAASEGEAIESDTAINARPKPESEQAAIPEEVQAALAALLTSASPVSPTKPVAVVSGPRAEPGAATMPAVPTPPAQPPSAEGIVVTARAETPEPPPAPAQPPAVPARPETAQAAAALAETLPPLRPVRQDEPRTPPPLPQPQGERGAEVVAAVREGRVAAATEEAPQGLTVRRLLSELVGQTRAETPQENASSVRAQAVLAEALPGDAASDARSSPLDVAARPTPLGEARPVGSIPVGTSAGDPAGAAPHARVPETVSVRDVGDFMIRSVRYLSGRTEEVVTVRLVPRSLGEMQIAVRSGGDGMEVIVTASTMAARDSIELQLGGLRDALARGGVDVTRVSVQTFTASGDGQPPAGSGNPGQSGHAPRGFVAHGSGAAIVPEAERPAWGPPRAQHEGGLNMLV